MPEHDRTGTIDPSFPLSGANTVDPTPSIPPIGKVDAHIETERALLAARFVNSTARHVFLTGKAGTGKTTFLHKLAAGTHKRYAILAPTGIAALNAGGVTIHSQFQLPFGAYVPEKDLPLEVDDYGAFVDRRTLTTRHPMNGKRRAFLRELDLLVVDEVSMLRADVLDVDAWDQGSGSYNVYLTGQTLSSDSIIQVGNATLFQQQTLFNAPGGNRSDGIILCLDGGDHEWIWTSYYGGIGHDRGWGIAQTSDELYVAGGTDTQQATFPLYEFDAGSPYDWYDADLSNNLGHGWGQYPYWGANSAGLFTYTASAYVPSYAGYGTDGWIASFGVAPNVGLDDEAGASHADLLAFPVGNGQWDLYLPDSGPWSVRVVDATGRLVTLVRQVTGPSCRIDLSTQAPGIYAVVAQGPNGQPLTVKIQR